MNRKIIYLITGLILVIILIGILLFVFSKSTGVNISNTDSVSDDIIVPTTPITDISNGSAPFVIEQDSTFYKKPSNFKKRDMVLYRNEEVGISFNYPRELGLREGVSSGVSGKKFSGAMFSTPPKYSIQFGGVTEDYSRNTGGSITDTLGYRKENSDYYTKFVWGESKVDTKSIVEILTVNDNKSEVLVVRNPEDKYSIQAFINIPTGQQFPGIVFSMTHANPGATIGLSEDEIDIFYQIISSVVFE